MYQLAGPQRHLWRLQRTVTRLLLLVLLPPLFLHLHRQLLIVRKEERKYPRIWTHAEFFLKIWNRTTKHGRSCCLWTPSSSPRTERSSSAPWIWALSRRSCRMLSKLWHADIYTSRCSQWVCWSEWTHRESFQFCWVITLDDIVTVHLFQNS